MGPKTSQLPTTKINRPVAVIALSAKWSSSMAECCWPGFSRFASEYQEVGNRFVINSGMGIDTLLHYRTFTKKQVLIRTVYIYISIYIYINTTYTSYYDMWYIMIWLSFVLCIWLFHHQFFSHVCDNEKNSRWHTDKWLTQCVHPSTPPSASSAPWRWGACWGCHPKPRNFPPPPFS